MTIQEAMAKAGLATQQQAQDSIEVNLFKAMFHEADKLVKLKTPATQEGNRGYQASAQR